MYLPTELDLVDFLIWRDEINEPHKSKLKTIESCEVLTRIQNAFNKSYTEKSND